jgi:hypothetical protein
MARIGRSIVRLLVGFGLAGVAWFFMSGEASAAPKPKAPAAPACVDASAVTGVSYTAQSGAPITINTPTGQIFGVVSGDTITVHFSVVSTQACPNGVELSFVSYNAPEPEFTPGQTLAAAVTQTFAPGGPYSLTLQAPLTSGGGSDPNCNPQHDNSNGGGANQSPGPYDPNGCGLPSGNGKSTNNNSSKPCAGCVGNADAKNPPGQYPNGGDPNAGYECDRNQGVGQTNPAHTGCSGPPHFQLDFVSGKPITDFTNTSYRQEGRLIHYANG